MRIRLETLVLAFLGAARAYAALPLPSPDEPWIVARSANFTLFSNAAPKAVVRIATDLERLRASLAQINPSLQLTSPYPTTLYVFRNDASFAPFQRLYQGRSAEVGGYFLSRAFGNYVAIGANPHGDDRALIYHEYLHYLLRNNYPDLPLWLNEGLAEYYSTFEVGRDEAKVGLPIEAHVVWLRLHPPMPLGQLLALDEDAPEYNEADRRGGFYAQAWVLTHYLMSGHGGRAGQLATLLARLREGKPAGEALRRTLGTSPEELAALDTELARYVKGYDFPYTRAAIAPGSEPKVEQAAVPRAEVLFRLGDLLANLDDSRKSDAEAYLRAALDLQPEHGGALGALARLEEDSGRREEAAKHHELAARLASGDWIVQYLYARNLIEGGKGRALAAARQALQKVVALRPDFGEAWADLGYTYQDEGVEGGAALAALETAHRLLPARPEVAYNLALAYAGGGRTEEAERLVEGALRSRPDLATKVRETLLTRRYNQVAEKVRQQDLPAALPLLREIQKQTTRPDFSAAIGREIEEIEQVLSHNGFTDRYNAAVDKVNRGDLKEAAAMLEKLVAETQDPYNAQKAKDLLGRIRHKLGPRRP